jgi:hypothetical protein
VSGRQSKVRVKGGVRYRSRADLGGRRACGVPYSKGWFCTGPSKTSRCFRRAKAAHRIPSHFDAILAERGAVSPAAAERASDSAQQTRAPRPKNGGNEMRCEGRKCR